MTPFITAAVKDGEAAMWGNTRKILEVVEAINRRTAQMSLDLSKLTASEQRLVADVERLLALVASTQSSLAALQLQIGQGNTTDATVQAALDAISANLDAESAKVETVSPVPNPGPTGTTGPATPMGNTGSDTVTGTTGSTGS